MSFPNAAALLLIGTELTDGRTADSHLQWLATTLRLYGIRFGEIAIIGDDFQHILGTLRRVDRLYGLIICCGGLGPTEDDVTQDVIEEYTGCPVFSADRHGNGLEKLPNNVGKAPGIFGKHNSVYLVALPGPPGELRPMVRHALLPRISALVGAHAMIEMELSIFGVPESIIDGAIAQYRSELASWGMRLGEWKVDALLRGNTWGALYAVAQKLRCQFGRHAVILGDRTIGEYLCARLRAHDHHLVSVESCTGGLFAAELLATPGASNVYWGGYIPYRLQAKQSFGIDRQALERHGAVSSEIAMALAARGLTMAKEGATLCAAITGAAGPQVADNNMQPGQAYIAVIDRMGNHTERAIHLSHYPRRVMQRKMASALFVAVHDHLSAYRRGGVLHTTMTGIH